VVMPFAMQVLLDAKMTLDEALQLRYGARSRFWYRIISHTFERKPPSALMRQPFAPADAAELLLASAMLGLLDFGSF
jgi:hypothetical protein